MSGQAPGARWARLAHGPRGRRPSQLRLPHRVAGYAGTAGMAMLLVLGALALVPGAVAPHDPTDTVGRPLERPSARFLLGTNDVGQDLLSELVWGARASLSTGLVVGVLAALLGTLVGLASGYGTGLWSAALMRLVDLTLALPFLPLVILLSAYLGQSQRNVLLVLVLVSWAGPARLVRSRVLALLGEPYIEAARAIGCGRLRILWRHIWPGVRIIAVVQLLLVASAAILAEASLSFLGLGDPSSKSWGSTLHFARASGAFLSDAWRWWVLPAGLMIMVAVLSLAMIGYTLEEILEPSLHRG